jgi:hypothetical protein
VRLPEGDIPASDGAGVSKSAVSRRFVALSAVRMSNGWRRTARLSSKGTTCKTVFDCTVPFRLKEHFVRSQFNELDPSPWAPSLFGKAAG